MADVTITDIYYDLGMWVAIVEGFPPVNGVPSDRQAFAQQAVETRMAIYDCTAQEAVAAMVNETLVNIENQQPSASPMSAEMESQPMAMTQSSIALPQERLLSTDELYPGMNLPLPPLSASARQMISRIEDQIRKGIG